MVDLGGEVGVGYTTDEVFRVHAVYNLLSYLSAS